MSSALHLLSQPEPSPQDSSFQNSSDNQTAPTAAYIHIPFCRRRCFYCDFPISVVGDRPPLSRQANQNSAQPSEASFGTIAEYVEVLCQEVRATASVGQSVGQSVRPALQTVFFGGGTPSLLTAEQLTQILTVLDQQFGIAAGAEISIEIDPGTFDQARLQGYRTAGINRVSLGVQAFQSELLAACGRTHTRADVDAAIELIHRVGLTNFSLDLISGLPHQTLDDWQESLAATIALVPTHVSVYDLTVETGTAFERWYQPGVKPLPTEEMTADMYRLAQQTLTQAGYQHYEVSNYAKPGYQCCHNRVYWQNRPYYGFGMGAASYLNQQRFTRPRKRREYYQWVQKFVATGSIDCLITPTPEVLLDTLMLGLRLAEGLSVQALNQQFGSTAVEQILSCLAPYQQKGWVGYGSRSLVQGSPDESSRIWLTDPEGFLFSNLVLADLFKTLDASD
jgi:oxygen-independent coproporphyrinogen-3 oxidase